MIFRLNFKYYFFRSIAELNFFHYKYRSTFERIYQNLFHNSIQNIFFEAQTYFKIDHEQSTDINLRIGYEP